MAAPAPWCLASRAQLKRTLRIDDAKTEYDDDVIDAGNMASDIINQACNRLLVYQGAAANESALVASTDPSVATSPLTGPFITQPANAWPWSTVTLQVDDLSYQLAPGVAGTFTIAGLDLGGNPISEVIPVSRGGVWWRGTKVFSQVISVAWTSLSGASIGRQAFRVGLAQAYTDYATIEQAGDFGTCRFRLIDYGGPGGGILNIVDIREDFNRNYDLTPPRVPNVDYIWEPMTGEVTRLAGSFPYPWFIGLRVVRASYVAGIADTGDKSGVPMLLNQVCRQLAALIYRENDRQMQGVSARSDAAGNTTKFSPAILTDQMQERLVTFKRDAYMSNVERAYA